MNAGPHTPWSGRASRICFVTTDFVEVIRNGGIGTHFWLMSQMLARRGWDVHVLFCGAVDDEAAMADMPERMAAHGITFTWLNEYPEPPWVHIPSYADASYTLLLSQRAMEALERLHAEHVFDIIEFPDWGALGFRAVQAKRSGIAFSDVALAVKLHSTTDWQRRGNLAFRTSPWDVKMEWCEKYAFERADLQFSPSQYMVEDTRAAGWEVREDVVVAYPFPPPETGEVAPASEIRELAFFGRLERRKGLDIFLDALEALDADLPVLFLGRDTRMDGRNASEIIEERLAARPHRIEDGLDRSAALAELRSGDRLAIIASQSETFGFTVAECVANEIPFVAASAGGIPEVVSHPEARKRWLFEPNAAGLAEAIQRQLDADGGEERELRRATAKVCDHERWNDEVEAKYRAALAAWEAKPHATVADDAPPATVSVAVTHYNHADFLPAALASLAAQTVAPDEVFVLDDGSTDERARRVFEGQRALYPEWTFIEQDNAGPGAGRNRCLELARGSYFLPFDSDNVARPELIETLLLAMQRDPSRAVATCHTLAFVDDADIESEAFAFRYAPTGGPRILSGVENLFGDTCALFRADALRSVGGFETDRSSPHEDWETLVKLAFSGFDIDVVPRPLFWYRTNIGGRLDSLTADPGAAFRLRQRMIETFLADVELDRRERIVLWECLLGYAQPNDELAQLQRAHDDVAEWAHATLAANHEWREKQLADNDAWREAQLEETRTFLEGQVREATLWAERVEAELREVVSRQGDPAPMVPVRDLWIETVRRTRHGVARRVRANAKTGGRQR